MSPMLSCGDVSLLKAPGSHLCGVASPHTYSDGTWNFREHMNVVGTSVEDGFRIDDTWKVREYMNMVDSSVEDGFEWMVPETSTKNIHVVDTSEEDGFRIDCTWIFNKMW